MSNFSDYVAIIAQVLSDDDIMNALVDGQIIPGFRRSKADSYLGGSNQACVGVRNILSQDQPLPGCAYHGISKYDDRIEIVIISISDDDVYAASIEAVVKRLLKGSVMKTMNNIAYNFAVGKLDFYPLNDDLVPANWIQRVGTTGITYLDV
jgi:hypothetical protein